MRESGFYWVKLYDNWTIGEFESSTNSWLVIGSEESCSDEHFDFVGEQIIQC